MRPHHRPKLVTANKSVSTSEIRVFIARTRWVECLIMCVISEVTRCKIKLPELFYFSDPPKLYLSLNYTVLKIWTWWHVYKNGIYDIWKVSGEVWIYIFWIQERLKMTSSGSYQCNIFTILLARLWTFVTRDSAEGESQSTQCDCEHRALSHGTQRYATPTAILSSSSRANFNKLI